MSDDVKSVVDVLATIGTLVIALAALVVARRQTTAAEQQASIAEDLKQLSAIQAEASQSQAAAAQAQQRQAASADAYMKALQTPQLVPADAQYLPAETGGTLRFALRNLGGGRARDVWIDEIAVIKPYVDWIGDPHDNLVVISAQQRIDVVVDESPVLLKIDLPPDFRGIEKVIRMSGHYVDALGDSHEIDYEAR